MKLKPGSLVYQVVNDIEEELRVVCVKVKTASDRRIELERPFPFKMRKRFEASALGRVFHLSPLEAIEHFAVKMRLEVDRADHARRSAEQSLSWAYQNGAKVPS